MKSKVLLLGNPLLGEKSLLVNNVNDREIIESSVLLKEALDEFRQENGFGRGIAAPQIGILKRMVALNLGKETFVIINPEIIKKSEETFTMWDDCMSFPDILVKVKRYNSVDITYLDEMGNQKVWENIQQSVAELLQHEIDHLDGILAVDRATGTGGIIYRTEYEKNKEYYNSQVDYFICSTIQ